MRVYSLFLTNEPSNNKEWATGTGKNEWRAEGRGSEGKGHGGGVCALKEQMSSRKRNKYRQKNSKTPQNILENTTAKEYKQSLFIVFTNTPVLLSICV